MLDIFLCMYMCAEAGNLYRWQLCSLSAAEDFEGTPWPEEASAEVLIPGLLKGSSQAVVFKHLGEHLPWLLVSRQAWSNRCVGNEWRKRMRERE